MGQYNVYSPKKESVHQTSVLIFIAMKGASTSKLCLNVLWAIAKRLVKSILVRICLCCLTIHVNTAPPPKNERHFFYSASVLFVSWLLLGSSDPLNKSNLICIVEEWFFTSLATSGPVFGVQSVYFLDSGVSFSVNSEGERFGKQRAEVKPRHCSWCKWSIMIRVAQHFSIDGRVMPHIF